MSRTNHISTNPQTRLVDAADEARAKIEAALVELQIAGVRIEHVAIDLRAGALPLQIRL